MPNVLIRDVPADDLDQIRSAAAARGTSLQSYLREAVHAQAAYLRRQETLTRAAERLRDQTEVPADERRAVLDAIADAHTERADQLSYRPAP
jgi:acyl-CoA reductase-like NAD-dependent aldehyde dehydrogenase